MSLRGEKGTGGKTERLKQKMGAIRVEEIEFPMRNEMNGTGVGISAHAQKEGEI